MFRKIIAIFTIGINLNTYAQPKIVDNTVAIVNDQMILYSDIRLQKMKDKDTTFEECNILKNLIINKLLYAKAEKDSLIVSEEEVNNEMDRRMDYFISVFGSQDKLEKYYKKTLIELKVSFRDDVKQQMMAERTKNKLLAGMTPSPKDVKEYFSKIKPDSLPYYNSEVQLAQIVFLPKITREDKRKMKLRAESIREKLIKKEADMATQAILYSDDTYSAAEGGMLNWINPGEMVPEFEQAAFSIPVGRISDVIETKYGFHILEVLEKKNNKVKVRHILLSPKPNENALAEAKVLADSTYIKIKDGRISFEKAVELYSDDNIFKSNGGVLVNMKTRSPVFEVGEIEPQLTPLLSSMKSGDITETMAYATLDKKVGYRIVKLLEETPPHRASLETDYNKIKEKTFLSLKDRALSNWLEFYKNFSFIRIDPRFNSCPELKSIYTKN